MKNVLRVSTLFVFLLSPIAGYADNSLSKMECQKLKKDIVEYVKDRLADKDSGSKFRREERAKGKGSYVNVRGYGRASYALNVYEHLCASD
jgi:hypothetical protein